MDEGEDKKNNALVLPKTTYFQWTSCILILFIGFVYGNAICLNDRCACCKHGDCPADNLFFCNGCIDGFTGPMCTNPCPAKCINCSQNYFSSDNKKCFACTNGYYNGHHLDLDDYVLRNDCSLGCKDGCESCTSYMNCTHCKSGLYLETNTCKDCPKHCGRCTSASLCLECEDGYFLHNGNCKHCNPNCATCFSHTDCHSCYPDSFLKGTKCEKCQMGCLSCNSENSCSVCQKGYYFNNSQCLRCHEGCDNCLLNSLSIYTCQQCREGYFNETNVCRRCGEGCTSCEALDDCQRCTVDYILENGTCVTCPSVFIHCFSSSNCTVCQANHYTENGSCIPCPANCISCSAEDNCFSCEEGYFGPQCSLSCPESCNNKQCNTTTGSCISCRTGYFFSENMNCEKCPQHCKDCVSNVQCIACNPGYQGETCDKECFNCREGTGCDKNTGICSNGCKDGLSSLHCNVSCRDYCLSCDLEDPSKCLRCVNERYGASCKEQCAGNCLHKTCNDSDGYCTYGCIDGFWGRNCEYQCVNVCKNSLCTRDNGQCLHGCIDYSEKKLCPCPRNCVCDTQGECVSCVDGFQGSECNTTCSEECVGRLCLRDTGECLLGCMNGFTGNNCSEVDKKSDGRGWHVTGTVGLAVGSAITAVMSFTIGWIISKKMKSRKQQGIGTNDRSLIYQEEEMRVIKPQNLEEIHDTTETSTPSNYEDVDKYYNTAMLRKRKIPIHALAEFVQNKTPNDFLEEFLQLPSFFVKSFKESQTKEKFWKNRYKGIYPYDETRVVLKSVHSDYINASFIDGYKKLKAYIASLGPTTKYMGDMSAFWTMVWQENCDKIVMLNNLNESQVTRCDQYWSDSEYVGVFGDFSISCQKEEYFTDWVVMTLEIQLLSEKRRIFHFHYTAWPEDGLPKDLSSLLAFRQTVHDVRSALQGPVVVHCSTGVGRTGTFIALDILTNEGEAEGNVDIFACVRNLRELRVQMVQTIEQYKYLHHALVRSLTHYSRTVKPGWKTKRKPSGTYSPLQIE